MAFVLNSVKLVQSQLVKPIILNSCVPLAHLLIHSAISVNAFEDN